MIGPESLPAVNACLNGLSAVLILVGFSAIRRKRINLHKRCMLAAFVVSSLFLASYLYYHLVVKHGEPTRFMGMGASRTLYLTVLLTHTVLAMAAAPMVVASVYLGLTNRLVRHVRLARWTMPIWLYVSLTGVLVYWMLYHLYPPA